MSDEIAENWQDGIRGAVKEFAEANANTIAFVYRDEVYDENSALKGVAEIITRKIRGGKPGTDCLEWKGDHQRFNHLDHRPDVEGIAEEQAAPKRKTRAF
jgi:hypothetical protein